MKTVKFSTTKKGHEEICRGDRHVNYLIVVMTSHVCVYVQTPQIVCIQYV